MTVTIEKPEPQIMSDLLCTAFEGGSSHWSELEALGVPGATELLVSLNEGAALVVQDIERGNTYELTLESCLRGWQVLHDSYPKQWAAAMAEDGDAETGDIYLQCCLFGEVIYG